MRAPLLRMEAVTKSFPGVLANDRVDFEVVPGEVHALLGENGSGKTTLMNVLYGIYPPDGGKIFLRGREVHFRSPRDAIDAGVGMVHQHFMLVPSLTVTQNIILGLPSPKGRYNPVLDLRAASARVAELSSVYGLHVDPKARIWQLPVGAQQRVEILKALSRGAELLILDEPTAVLTPNEVNDLFRVLRLLAERGCSVIFITHKLFEVMAVADRVTVLRNGRVVAIVRVDETTPAVLTRMMVGREIVPPRRTTEAPPGPMVLSVEDLWVRDSRGLPALKGVTFDLAEGEILGVAGVDGNGQKELAETIAGLRQAERGKVAISGAGQSTAQTRRRIGFVPEDRRRTGLVLGFSIAENLVLKVCDQAPFARWVGLDPSVLQQTAKRAIAEFDIRAGGPQALASTLSGGNQQKLVLARELGLGPRLILAAQPTRGLDVGATEYVQRRLLEAREKGAAILLISTELDEILALSDRILVLHGGEVMGVIDGDDATPDVVGMMMAGTPLEKIRSLAS